MSYPRELDGTRLHNWAARAVAELSARRAEINALNVFPVPDADTGSNMAHTMEAALAEVDRLEDTSDVVRVAQAIAAGSVRGARGNSGVVLSQVLRAVAESAVDGRVDGEAISRSLTTAVSLVDRAISEPVEGTVITVLRAAAVAARETGGALHDVVTAAVDAARTALAKTPSQLDVLREAGVVDAGGTGFLVLIEALLAEIEGTGDPGGDDHPGQVVPESHGRAAELEVMFYFRGDLDALEEELSGLGDSLLVARADDTEGTVHLHSHDAGTVIEWAFAAGEVSDLRLEVLPDAPQVEAPNRIVVAVTPAGSVAELYREAGAVVVTPGRDAVTEILGHVRRCGAEEVILLPNGLLDRRQLVAVERATHAFEQAITLLPTARLVSGIAALTVHEPEDPLGVAAYAMSEAASAMRTAVLTRAEKAALTPAGPCAKGDIIVTSLGEIILVADTLDDAVLAACRRLLESGGEQVTVLAGEEIDVEELRARLRVDVMAFPADELGHLAEIGVE
ncbi:DAK2 domain-containing protein [Corynebacterium halotolerans]|uniref:DhaL domain-containing protein n=1 Tax=Corynebacterium halotolerans YIM 70093 = DSM 44683 TaxID=1121362 RepID=M1NLQ3_9CORY|nr:DAK2 domain-containing protein [Corynebacterium halotolerans]AGF72333.1 hypothetical protein A605_06655 [Corynebacterium halotolerans YIM 70093 = DSM 44683]